MNFWLSVLNVWSAVMLDLSCCLRWRRMSAGLLISVGVIVIAGAGGQRPKLIEAEQFDLVDSSGKATARLFNTPEGKPVLSFFHQGANVLNLGVSSQGIADMVFYDRSGKLRIGLILDENHATLGLYDATRKAGATLSSAADGTSGLVLFHRDRKDQVALGTKPDGGRQIKVADNAGKTVFEAPMP